MIEIKNSIPNESILKRDEGLYNYIDSFHGRFVEGDKAASLKDFVKLFIYSGPKWADTLMALRDKLVGIFGLKVSSQLTNKVTDPDNIQLEIGEQLDIHSRQTLSSIDCSYDNEKHSEATRRKNTKIVQIWQFRHRGL